MLYYTTSEPPSACFSPLLPIKSLRPEAPLVTSTSTSTSTHRVLPLLVLLGAGLAVADEVVEGAVLDERREHEDEAHGHKQVHGRHVGHLGQGLPGDGTERGHGEHGGDAWPGEGEDKETVAF